MTSIKLSLADYLILEDGTDSHQEFVDGQIIEMSPESPQNSLISLYLLVQFLKLVPITRLRHKDTEIVDPGKEKVNVLTLVDGLYEAVEYAGCDSDRIKSLTFPDLTLTVEQILKAKE